MVKADAKEFDGLAARFDKVQRAKNIANAEKFGVEAPGTIIDEYAGMRAKWRPLTANMGRDIQKFADLLCNEVYAKVDPDKL